MGDLVEVQTRDEVLWAARAIASSGLAPATQGNISARDRATGHIVLTPHDRWYDGLTRDDLVILDATGRRVGGGNEPSFDHEVHCAVYRERPEVMSVIHTEPPFVNAFGVVGREIPPVTTTGLKSCGSAVPIMAFEWVRDDAFAKRMLAVMGSRHAIVWRNHGLLVVGASVHQALARTFGVEFNAKVAYLAGALGMPQLLAYGPGGDQVIA